jgi:hypothetical protein
VPTASTWTAEDHAALIAHDPAEGWLALAQRLHRSPRLLRLRYRRMARYRLLFGRWPAWRERRPQPRPQGYVFWTVRDDDALCDAVRELATLPVMQVAALVQPRFPARTVEAVRQRIIFLDPWDRRDD